MFYSRKQKTLPPDLTELKDLLNQNLTIPELLKKCIKRDLISDLIAFLDKKKLIPELRNLVAAAEAKDTSERQSDEDEKPILKDRGAAFVFLPESMQLAIVRLVRDCATLPRDKAFKDIQLQLHERDRTITRLQKEPEDLFQTLQERSQRLAVHLNTINVQNALIDAQMEELRGYRQAERAAYSQDVIDIERDRKTRRAERKKKISSETMAQRYEAFLDAAHLYQTALDEASLQDPKERKDWTGTHVAEHIRLIRAKLTATEKMIPSLESTRNESKGKKNGNGAPSKSSAPAND